MVILLAYSMTQPFVSSGTPHTDGNTIQVWSQQADMIRQQIRMSSIAQL